MHKLLVNKMTSDICLLQTKTIRAGPITFVKIPFNLLTMTLDMHLHITLQHERGLKSFIMVGVSILGTKAILVALTHLGRVEE